MVGKGAGRVSAAAAAAILSLMLAGCGGGDGAGAQVPESRLALGGVWSVVGSNLFDDSGPPGGYAGDGTTRMSPPYNAEYQAKADAVWAQNVAGTYDDPTGSCLPPGMPRVMTSPYLMEIVVQPHQVVFLREYQHLVRRIHTDGRAAPQEVDPTYDGYSVGRWEGDTLVVETTGLREDTVFDATGMPHSDAMRVTERIRLAEPGLIENQMTIEDPKAFTRPWVVTRRYKAEPKGTEIMEYVCLDNNRPVFLPGQNDAAG